MIDQQGLDDWGYQTNSRHALCSVKECVGVLVVHPIMFHPMMGMAVLPYGCFKFTDSSRCLSFSLSVVFQEAVNRYQLRFVVWSKTP